MKNLVINGRKSVQELIEDEKLNYLIETVFLTSTQKFLIDLCKQYSINFEIKGKEWFNKFASKEKYKNALAFLKEKNQLTIDEIMQKVSTKKQSLVVFLDKLQDPYNFGAILRSCAAVGVDAVIYSKHAQTPINSAVIKASQGYALKIDVVTVTNLSQTLEKFKNNGFWSYSTSIDEDSKDYRTIKFENKTVLIFGNEGHGVSEHLNKNADFRVKIPLSENVDSLNVSVCAGILIFEWAKLLN